MKPLVLSGKKIISSERYLCPQEGPVPPPNLEIIKYTCPSKSPNLYSGSLTLKLPLELKADLKNSPSSHPPITVHNLCFEPSMLGRQSSLQLSIVSVSECRQERLLLLGHPACLRYPITSNLVLALLWNTTASKPSTSQLAVWRDVTHEIPIIQLRKMAQCSAPPY